MFVLLIFTDNHSGASICRFLRDRCTRRVRRNTHLWSQCASYWGLKFLVGAGHGPLHREGLAPWQPLRTKHHTAYGPLRQCSSAASVMPTYASKPVPTTALRWMRAWWPRSRLRRGGAHREPSPLRRSESPASFCSTTPAVPSTQRPKSWPQTDNAGDRYLANGCEMTGSVPPSLLQTAALGDMTLCEQNKPSRCKQQSAARRSPACKRARGCNRVRAGTS